MKIFIDTNSELKGAFTRRFYLQGDVIAPKHEAEICLTDEIVSERSKSVDVEGRSAQYSFTICHTLDKFIRDGIGYSTTENPNNGKNRIVLTRFFDNRIFWEQTLLTVPVIGDLNDDLGDSTCVSVSCGRYIKHPAVNRLFDDAPLIEFLKSLKYKGFLSLELVGSKVVNIHLGIPFLGWLNALQGCRYDLAYWLKSPEPLLESWSTVLRVSLLQSSNSSTMQVPQGFERRVWLNSDSLDRDSVLFSSDLLGYVCTWNPHLREASRHAIQICRSIDCPSKSYRIDFVNQIEERFRGFLQELDGA